MKVQCLQRGNPGPKRWRGFHMMRAQVAGLFVILLFFSSVAHAQWMSVNPPALSNDWQLMGVHFPSIHEGWAVGWDAANDVPVMLHYSGGVWSFAASPSTGPEGGYLLSGVHFTSETEGWAVGEGGNPAAASFGVMIHHSGATWLPASIPAAGDDWTTWKVHFPSADDGWVVGYTRYYGSQLHGLLLHYSNGAWTVVEPPFVTDEMWTLESVHFTSESEGWAVGKVWFAAQAPGVLLHYLNGQWSKVNPPTVSAQWALWGVHFTSPSEGWAVGTDYTNQKAVLLHYSEGTWTSVSPPAGVGGLMAVHFTSASEGWAVGGGVSGGNSILHYSGGTWVSDSPPEGSWTYWDIHFPTPNEGWIVGRNEETGTGALLHFQGLRVTTPGGGEKWKRGKTHTIRWSYAGNSGSSVRVELLKGGVPDSMLATGIPIGTEGEGSHDWAIPSQQAPGTDYKVRVTVEGNEAYTDTGADFSIIKSLEKPGITLKAPNGGESWYAGTNQTIRWNFSRDTGANVKIELLDSKGKVVSVIANSTPSGDVGRLEGEGTYKWAIPSAQKPGQYGIRISSTAKKSIKDTSNSSFTIHAPFVPPTITVVSPNGGESWQAGVTHTIQWSYTGAPGSMVKIEAYRTAGTALAYFPIVASAPVGTGGTGAYSWTIPATQPVGSDYKISVTSTTNSSYTDISDNYFSITAGPSTPAITVTSLNGGETVQAGWTGYMNPNIQWHYTGNPGANVKIELLKGGSLNSVIAASVPVGNGGSGSYYWYIPPSQAAGTDYRIRITSTSNASYTDTSNGDFTITAAPTITVTSPNGGESWQPGSPHAISWTYSGSLFSPPFDSIKIELLKGGVLNSTIASNVPVTSGSYNWTVPGGQTAGSDYRIRLIYTFYDQISDTSDGNFTIEPCFSPASVTVVSPNGGESWLRGTAHTIQWSYVGCPGTNVKIELIETPIGAQPITTLIVNSAPLGASGSGSYNWLIPAGSHTGNIFKVKVTADLGPSDTSNNFFSISATF